MAAQTRTELAAITSTRMEISAGKIAHAHISETKKNAGLV